MKTAIVAFNPMELKGQRFEHFCENVRALQEQGLISRTSIVSVIHGSLYLMPYEYYKKHEDELAREAKLDIQRACNGRFRYKSVRVLQADSSSNEELVEHLSRSGRQTRSDILVLSSNDRAGLPYWLIGSVSETAALTASMPVLILKNSSLERSVSHRPTFVVNVDVAAPPSARDTTWLAGFARSSKAHLALVYVAPRPRALIGSLQLRKEKSEATQVLKRVKISLLSKGAKTVTFKILPESRSIAHTIADFAEQEGAWLTVATTAKRSRTRRLLLGSTARHILQVSKLPFLSLRLE